MTKKTDKVTDQGAVEVQEEALDQATGGILIGLNQGIKLSTSALKIADGSVLKIVDGSSNTWKF